MKPCRTALLSTLAGAVWGASAATPAIDATGAAQLVLPPVAWQAPLPGNGERTDLLGWWERFNDPLLPSLISAAQAASPTLASAQARIERARATRVAAGAALSPQLDAVGAIGRRDSGSNLPITRSASADLLAGWEIDLFGGNRAAHNAAQARLEGTQAQRAAAYVSLAAETASSYLALRACEAQLVLAQVDNTSRTQTERLTALSAQVGFTAPADAALARASAAQGRAQEATQHSQCELLVKSLVEVTALDEAALRQQLATATARLPQPSAIVVSGLPADLLAQRPDLSVALRAVIAAAGDQTQSAARQRPQVSLSSSFGGLRVRSGDISSSGATWSIGPLLVSLPLFDGGARAADSAAARAAYDEAVQLYQAQLRLAVREVEQALVQLQGTALRADDTRIAATGFDQAQVAAEARWQGGLGSLLDLEVARRAAVGANSTRVELERERIAAWIALYRALGGGWRESDVLSADALPR